MQTFQKLKDKKLDRVNTDLDAFIIDVNIKIEPRKKY